MTNTRRAGVAVLLGSMLLAMPAGVAVGAAGDLDSSFDGDGVRTIDYGANDGASALGLRPDGRILVAGYGNVATDFAVQGLLSDGSDDPSCASQGYLGVGLNGLDYGQAMALQRGDGKIVVAGTTFANIGAGGDLAVVRRNPDGSPDMSFAGTGQQIIDYAGGNDQAGAVALDGEGRIVIAGSVNTATDVALERFRADGTPELSVAFKLDGLDNGQALALQPDGKILIAGATRPQGKDQDLAILRAHSHGGLDSSFAGDGKRIIDYDGHDGAQAIALQPDGRIVIVGSGYPKEDILVDRLLPDGSDDPSFNPGGSSGIAPDITDDGNAVALQPDGKILVAGTTYGVGGSDAVVVRIQPGGALDTTFDGDGKKTIDLGGSDGARALALQPNGRILVAGRGGSGADLAVIRLLGDPGSAAGGGRASGSGGAPGVRSGVPRCAGKPATIVGTAVRDRLRGTGRADVIVTLGGNDVAKGGRGNDLICSGSGNDRVLGNSGRDRLIGQRGLDRLLGAAGNDRLHGGAGKDRLAGGPGRDHCPGGPGRDRATCEIKRGI